MSGSAGCFNTVSKARSASNMALLSMIMLKINYSINAWYQCYKKIMLLVTDVVER